MVDASLLRDVAQRPEARAERASLQRYDWLSAALEIFVEEGIDAVRITRLADDLGVTRGSFYWHFDNRQDLIEALVTYWREKNTTALVRAVEAAETLEEGVFNFFETCVDESRFDSRLDLAIREWARRSMPIRSELDRADNERIEAIRSFYRRFGYPAPGDLIRARVIYFAQIGFYALDVRESMTTRIDYTRDYYECFTGRQPDPGAEADFRQRMLETFGEDGA